MCSFSHQEVACTISLAFPPAHACLCPGPQQHHYFLLCAPQRCRQKTLPWLVQRGLVQLLLGPLTSRQVVAALSTEPTFAMFACACWNSLESTRPKHRESLLEGGGSESGEMMHCMQMETLNWVMFGSEYPKCNDSFLAPRSSTFRSHISPWFLGNP